MHNPPLLPTCHGLPSHNNTRAYVCHVAPQSIAAMRAQVLGSTGRKTDPRPSHSGLLDALSIQQPWTVRAGRPVQVGCWSFTAFKPPLTPLTPLSWAPPVLHTLALLMAPKCLFLSLSWHHCLTKVPWLACAPSAPTCLLPLPTAEHVPRAASSQHTGSHLLFSLSLSCLLSGRFHRLLTVPWPPVGTQQAHAL